MKKFFKWGSNEEGKGKKASLRTGEGLVRSADIPAYLRQQQPALLLENGAPENEAPDAPPNRPVPSFITNSANLPSYGQPTAAVPLPLPSEPVALPLPEPALSTFPANQEGNPHSLPTEDSLSPAGFGYTNPSPVRAHNESDVGDTPKSGLTISRTGPNKAGYPSSRPHQGQKGLVSKSNSKGKGGSQNPIQFNFPNQRPSPLETVLSGPKRGQVSKPITDATASEPSVSPQPSELSSGVNTPRSNPDWMSSVPPVSPYWRASTSPLNQLQNKLRRSPSGSHPDANPEHSNNGSPLSRFSPVAQAHQAAILPPVPGRVGGKSAPSSPARSESSGPGKVDGFGSGASISSAISEPLLATDLEAAQSEMLESNTRPASPGLEEKRDALFGRRLMGIEQQSIDSGQDDTSDESSSLGGSESTESSAAGAWLNGSSPGFATNRVHFDLNAPHVEAKSNLGMNQTQFRGSLVSPKPAHVLGMGEDVAADLFPQQPVKSPEAQRKKEVGEEDLTRSITPRTAEALQGVQKRMPRHGEGSQAGSPIPLSSRSPQKAVGGPGYRGQRPVNTHLNVPKQLSPITAGPAWHESIAGLPVLSSEATSNGPQAHPLPDIDHTYPPASFNTTTPSPTEGMTLPPVSAARGSARPFSNRNLASPETHPHHARASSDGRTHVRSSENISPGGGRPVRLSDVGGGSRITYHNDVSPLALDQNSRARTNARGLPLDASHLPKSDMHHLPLSEATRTLSDPILPRSGQRRPSLDQGAKPLPLPLPPAEEKLVSKGVSPNQGPLSPSGQPSPLPGLPPAGYLLNLKQNPLVSPSQTTLSPSPHPSPISVLQQGDRTSRDFSPPTPRLPVNWKKGDKLGSGTFGSVFKALDSDTGKMFAVKEVGEAQQNVRDESVSQLEQEISLLSRLKHPNIVQYVGTKRENGNLYIFLEYMSGGSIESMLRCYGKFNEALIRAYTKQILCGLKYLHDMSTIHRDIKGANILVDIHGTVKLADFGMAKQICEGSSLAKSGMKGSPYWMAPEVVRHEGGADGRPADIWSVGCTVLEMADGVPPWSRETTNAVHIIYKIASSKDPPHIPNHLSDTAVDFIKTCLNRFPDQRPRVDELLRHPFIADVAPDVMVDLPRSVGHIVPRAVNRTSQSPLTPRLMNTGLRNAMDTEESVSVTVQALVDAPSPRAGGPKGLGGVGGTSGKKLGGGGKSRPKTPPPNWSPSSSVSDEFRGNVKSRFRISKSNLEQTAKPSLRWKSPPSLQSREESVETPKNKPDHFTDFRVEIDRRPPLVRHKSADAPLRFPAPRGRLLDDGNVELGRLHKGASAPLEDFARQDGAQDSSSSRIATHKRWLREEVG